TCRPRGWITTCPSAAAKARATARASRAATRSSSTPPSRRAMSAPEAPAAAAPAFTLDLDLKVGKYDVQKMLGKGATGTVYLAKDTFSGREVALKAIEPEVFRDPEFGTVYRSQFLNEASLAGKLRHPYIVNILDAVGG